MTHGTNTESSIYRQVLGTQFDNLPPRLKSFHDALGKTAYAGEAEVEGPRGFLATILAILIGAPSRSGRGTIQFILEATSRQEHWTRIFAGKTMRSTLRPDGLWLVERLGAAKAHLALSIDGSYLRMKLVRLTMLGIPCPQWLMPRVVADECQRDDRLYFIVEAEVPFAGRVIAYRGYLEPTRDVSRSGHLHERTRP